MINILKIKYSKKSKICFGLNLRVNLYTKKKKKEGKKEGKEKRKERTGGRKMKERRL